MSHQGVSGKHQALGVLVAQQGAVTQIGPIVVTVSRGITAQVHGLQLQPGTQRIIQHGLDRGQAQLDVEQPQCR
ncbi:MAG: hypothetical protein VYB99_08480 [Pseudomonadota bacterium]|nr:hypothetical protein [Pseudomonadota bacterium]